MLNRIDVIALRSQEHGLTKYFKSLSKRTFKQDATSEIVSKSLDPNSLVAKPGGLQEILIACVIYLLGVSLGIIIFIVEYFLKKNSAEITVYKYKGKSGLV